MSDNLMRRYNYDLCTAIDLTKLGIVLEKMVKSGHVTSKSAELYMDSAGSLLKLLRIENERAF